MHCVREKIVDMRCMYIGCMGKVGERYDMSENEHD